jgi:ATP-dependent DNA ligase
MGRPSFATIGLAVFDLIRGHASNARAILCAFDLLEVNGKDIRREPIEERKPPRRTSTASARGHRLE